MKLGTSFHIQLGSYTQTVQKRLAKWEEIKFVTRLWEKDPALWVTPKAMDWLGWLSLPEVMSKEIEVLQDFANEVAGSGIEQVVLLGMGGSSLAPEVLMHTLGNASGFPQLIVLDNTHPDAITTLHQSLDLNKTLFLVSSKSGSTIEPLSFFHYFWEAVQNQVPAGTAGDHFVAITDPDSKLEQMAQAHGFRQIFSTPKDVGGRYSALTYFGLVPAALLGIDLNSFLEQARDMARTCQSNTENPGLLLGSILGELALAGRDKVTFLAPPELAAITNWIEQLIAESTGKEGKGILPVANEPRKPLSHYGADRLFISLQMAAQTRPEQTEFTNALAQAGHPVVTISLPNKASLAAEFFRWEVATAAAGTVLDINPFDQPDVELAKTSAREAMATFQQTGAFPKIETTSTTNHFTLSIAPPSRTPASINTEDIHDILQTWYQQGKPGDYLALMAYLPNSPEIPSLLTQLQAALGEQSRLPTTLGYGPRFLHSTGQLHKGGKNNGLFLQITDHPSTSVPVPTAGFDFNTLIRAQAIGDYQALTQRGRRVLQVHLTGERVESLRQLLQALQEHAPK